MAKFWRRWVADLHAKTIDLSLEERGAYDALMDYYYLNGGAITSDHVALYRVVRCAKPSERQAVDAMLKRFFTRTENGKYFHVRCEEELAKQTRYESAQSRRGKMGAAQRWKGNGQLPGDDSPVVETLMLRDGSEFGVTETFLAQLDPLYPLVDVRATILNMKGWLFGNPTQRKTARGMGKFISGWLAKEQEKYAQEDRAKNA